MNVEGRKASARNFLSLVVWKTVSKSENLEAECAAVVELFTEKKHKKNPM